MANIGNLTGNVPATQLQSTNPGTPTTGSTNWRNFRFSNPTSPDQQNFNWLAQQNPDAAFSYAFQGNSRPGASGISNQLREALDSGGWMNGGSSGMLLGQYNHDSGGDPTQFGMSSDWNPGRSSFGGSGQFTYGDQNYTLPTQVNTGAHTFWGQPMGTNLNAQDLAFVQQNDAHNQQAQQAQKANTLGGQNWWDAVKNFQTTQGGPPATAGGATPAGGATAPTNNVGQSDSAGSMGGVTGQGTTTPASNFNEAAGNYTGGMKLSDYLNPATDWAQQQGLKGLQSTYAAGGMLNSGSAMKGISDYMTNSTLNNAWQPAFNNYMADKGFNYGVDTGDRNFNYQAQMNDQTIPWQQQMQLAQLGMQGAGGQSNINNLLATLLSQNALSAGQTGASGTIGGSNAINNALSQYLSQYLSQQYLNKIPGQG